jgi:hypothetical protein
VKLFGYEIRRLRSLRENSLSPVFLGLMVISFFMATVNSAYFADFRFGDSIIPKEDQLVRSGPYIMKRIKVRNGSLIKFSDVKGGEEYSEQSIAFDQGIDILSMVEALQNAPVSYLWLYPNNPIRKVWKVQVNDQTVLSYERALFNYRFDSSPEFYLGATVFNLLMFLLSMLRIKRVVSENLKKI